MFKKILFGFVIIMMLNRSLYAMQLTLTNKQQIFRKTALRDLSIGTIIPSLCGIIAAVKGDITKEKILIPLVSGALSSSLGLSLGIYSANRMEKDLIEQEYKSSKIEPIICNHLDLFSFRWTCVSVLLIGMGTFAFIKLNNNK